MAEIFFFLWTLIVFVLGMAVGFLICLTGRD
jgi:hypothetical protein